MKELNNTKASIRDIESKKELCVNKRNKIEYDSVRLFWHYPETDEYVEIKP